MKALRWAWIVWFVLMAGILGRVAVSRPTKNSVVPIYSLGGERWRASEALYEPSPGGLDVYRNPPGVAALFAPLSELSPRALGLLWRAAGMLLYAGVLAWFAQVVGLAQSAPWRRALFWIVAGVAALPALDNGQINLWIVSAVVGGVAAQVAGRPGLAMAWWVFAAWWKVYPVAALGLGWLTKPRFRLAAVAGLVALLLGAAPLLTQSWDYVRQAHLDFWATLQNDDRTGAALERAPKDWTALPRVGLGIVVPRPVPQIVAGVVGLGLGILAVGVVRRWPLQSQGLWVLEVSLFWMVLFGPATEPNTYSLLAPALAVRVAKGSVGGLGSLALTLWGLGLLSGAVPGGKWLLIVGLQPVAAVLWLTQGALSGWYWQPQSGWPQAPEDSSPATSVSRASLRPS